MSVLIMGMKMPKEEALKVAIRDGIASVYLDEGKADYYSIIELPDHGDLIDRERMDEPRILDVTCGPRSIWFQKDEPHTIFCDKRREEWERFFGDKYKGGRHVVVDPDVLCDFTDLPFRDEQFNLVVFDPPHVEGLKDSSWLKKEYGSLDGDWRKMLHEGFLECMRVLKIGGVLIFKWCDVSISTREVIKAIGQEPLFGHRSGKKMNTHWMCFMKFKGEED